MEEKPRGYWKHQYMKLLKKTQALEEQLEVVTTYSSKYKLQNKKHKRIISQLLDRGSATHSFPTEESSSISTHSSLQLSRDHTPRVFEAFVVMGTPPDGETVQVLGQFPKRWSWQREALASFCFPKGHHASTLDLSKSGTALFQLLYPSYDRDEQSFVFTLQAPQSCGTLGSRSILNNAKETLFGCCVLENDLVPTTDPFRIPVSPKCYCLLSYFPCFDLHFQVLYTFLTIKKAERIAQANMPYAPLEYISTCQTALLENYYEQVDIVQSPHVKIQLDGFADIETFLPVNYTYLDVDWACPLMLSLLSIEELFQVVCAAMTEKSIVFVSDKLGYASSCVLGLQSLMRPFKWPHLLSPVLPLSLHDILEAPVPFIVGVSSVPANFSHSDHVQFMFLDEVKRKKRLRGVWVSEPHANDLKSYISIGMQCFEGTPCFRPTPEQVGAARKVTAEFIMYWSELISAIEASNTKNFERVRRGVVQSSPSQDQQFLKALVNTQLFTQMIEEVLTF